MKKIKIITIITILTLLHISCSDSTSGGETLNEKIALYMPDGVTPAVDASVKFFSIGDTSATPIYQTQTDAEGRYTVSGVTSTGYYNVIAEYEDSLFSMQDTIYISQESHLVKDDTLNNPGSISGVVALQPNHSHLLDNVYVMALGMGRAVNVDSTGWFTMTKLAPGDYNLQVDTDIEKYGPKFVDVTISSSVNDTIADTITLPYSGVPVVSNIRCEYDTLKGIVSVNWNKSSYGNVYSYVIFKKSIDSLFFPKDPIGWVSSTDTIYKDTIFTKPVLDTSSQNYDYTVAIIDSSTTTGPINSFSKVVGISPLKVTTDITIQTYNKETQLLVDTFSTDDTLQIVLKASNSFRPYKNITWSINHPDSIIKQVSCDTINPFLHDTLFQNFLVEDNYKLYVTIEDMAETSWKDSLSIPIWIKPKPLSLFIDSIFTHYAYLRWNKSTDHDFKSYTICRSTNQNFESSFDTTIFNINDTILSISSLTPGTKWFFKSIINDSSNLKSQDIITSDTTMSIWSKLDPMPTPRTSHTCELIKEKVYLFGGWEIWGGGLNSVEEYDLKTKVWSTKQMMPTLRQTFSSTTVNDKIYLIGGFNSSGKLSLNEEYDPINNKYIEKAPMPTPRSELIVCSFQGKIFTIGGIGVNRNISNAFEIYDPITDSWTKMPPCPYDNLWPGSEVVIKDKIFIFLPNNTYVYDITDSTWSEKSPLPKETSSISIIARTLIDSTALLIADDGYGNKKTYFYNPISDSWNNKDDIKFPASEIGLMYSSTCYSFNGKVYVLGGTDSTSSGGCSTFLKYNPNYYK